MTTFGYCSWRYLAVLKSGSLAPQGNWSLTIPCNTSVTHQQIGRSAAPSVFGGYSAPSFPDLALVKIGCTASIGNWFLASSLTRGKNLTRAPDSCMVRFSEVCSTRLLDPTHLGANDMNEVTLWHLLRHEIRISADVSPSGRTQQRIRSMGKISSSVRNQERLWTQPEFLHTAVHRLLLLSTT